MGNKRLKKTYFRVVDICLKLLDTYSRYPEYFMLNL